MLKKILLSASGTLLALLSLLCLAGFLSYVFTPSKPVPLDAAGIVFYWIAILGAGAGGFFLLRAGHRIVRAGRVDDDDDEMYKGDYDDEDAP